MLIRVIGALLITYAVSRATRRLSLPLKGGWAVIVPHLLSLALICLFVFALRHFANSFELNQLAVYIVPQFFWLTLDYLRTISGETATRRS